MSHWAPGPFGCLPGDIRAPEPVWSGSIASYTQGGYFGGVGSLRTCQKPPTAEELLDLNHHFPPSRAAAAGGAYYSSLGARSDFFTAQVALCGIRALCTTRAADTVAKARPSCRYLDLKRWIFDHFSPLLSLGYEHGVERIRCNPAAVYNICGILRVRGADQTP